MSSTGKVGRSSIASSLSPRASFVVRVAGAGRVACATRVARDHANATRDLAATDLVPTDSVRFIEELVLRRPQAPAGLRRDQAKHETIASGSHGGTHTVRLYYNLWQYICN
jgi:hypothetical protein